MQNKKAKTNTELCDFTKWTAFIVQCFHGCESHYQEITVV